MVMVRFVGFAEIIVLVKYRRAIAIHVRRIHGDLGLYGVKTLVLAMDQVVAGFGGGQFVVNLPAGVRVVEKRFVVLIDKIAAVLADFEGESG
jgi:hypothetical protein